MAFPHDTPMKTFAILGVGLALFTVSARADLDATTAFLLAPDAARGEKSFSGTLHIKGDEAEGDEFVLREVENAPDGWESLEFQPNENTVFMTENGEWRERESLREGQKVRVVGATARGERAGLVNTRVVFLPADAPVAPAPFEGGSTSQTDDNKGAPPLAVATKNGWSVAITHAGFYPVRMPKNIVKNEARRFLYHLDWRAPRPQRINELGWRLSAQNDLGQAFSPQVEHDIGAISPNLEKLSLIWNARNPRAPEGSDGYSRSLLEWKNVPISGEPVPVDQSVQTPSGRQITLKSAQLDGQTLRLDFLSDQTFQINTSWRILVFDGETQLQTRGGGHSGGSKDSQAEVDLSEPLAAKTVDLKVLFTDFQPEKVLPEARVPLRLELSPAALWRAHPQPEKTLALPPTNSFFYGDYEQERPQAQVKTAKVSARLEANPAQFGQYLTARVWLSPLEKTGDDGVLWMPTGGKLRADGQEFPLSVDRLYNPRHPFFADGTLAAPDDFDDVVSVEGAKKWKEYAKLEWEIEARATRFASHDGVLESLEIPRAGASSSLPGAVLQGDSDGFFRPIRVASFASMSEVPALPDWAKERWSGPVSVLVFEVAPVTGDAQPKVQRFWALSKEGAVRRIENLASPLSGDVLGDNKAAKTFSVVFQTPPAGERIDIYLGASEAQAMGEVEKIVFPAIENGTK